MPGIMWRTPVDTGEEMAELCRTDGHDTVPVLPLAKHVIGELSASRRDPAQLRVIVMCPENTPAVAARAPGGPGTGAGTVGEERYPDGRPAHERFLATAAMIMCGKPTTLLSASNMRATPGISWRGCAQAAALAGASRGNTAVCPSDRGNNR